MTEAFNFIILIFVLCGKGGVGKTLLSLLLADLLDLNDIPYDVIQIDDQDKLRKTLQQLVTSVDIALLRRARKDPNVLTAAFKELYARIESMPTSRRSLLIDVGATQQHSLLDYAALTELNADLREFGIPSIAFVPVVTDPEAIEQASRQIEVLARVMPSVQPIVVINERDGKFEAMAPSSEAARLYRERLHPLMKSLPKIVMPKVEADSWQHYERQHCRLLDAIGLDVKETMSITGLSRPEAKLARGDVAAWVQAMESEIIKVLPILNGGNHE